MKKRLSFLLAAILVFLLVLTSCGGGDPYKGNYEEISEEQAQEYLDRLYELEEVLEGKSMKTTFSVTTTDDDNGDKSEVSGTSLADFSDPDNRKVYEEMTVKRTTEDGTYKLSIKAYSDTESGKTLIEVKASAPEKDDYSFKGQIKTDGLYALQNMTGSVGVEDVFYALEEALEDLSDDEGTTISVDGDKVKMVYESTEEWGTEKGEVYAVITEDGFRCKMTANTHMNYGETDTEEVEIRLVSEKVEIPTSGYDSEMTAKEFVTVLTTYMGYDD